jgi:DNA-binding response OmpR family regulator
MTNILLVNGNRDVSDILRVVLDIEGNRTSQIRSPAQALAVLLAVRPETLVFDRFMHPMDALDFAIAARRLMPHVRMVMISTTTGDKDRAVEFGVNQVVESPFLMEDIVLACR